MACAFTASYASLRVDEASEASSMTHGDGYGINEPLRTGFRKAR